MINFMKTVFMRHPIIRYLSVGGFNTLMSLAIYYSLLKLGLNYLLASAITNIFGVLEGFLLNAIIVFKHKVILSSLLKYSSVYVISFILNLILMYIWVDCLFVSKLIAPILTLAIITILNYFLVKRFVFIRV